MDRDTDADWRAIAEANPYFGVLTDKKFLNPTVDALEEFFATGVWHVDHTLSVIRRFFGDFAPGTALDFGCGVGRLTLPMARVTGAAVGVDIANRMLDLAKAHAAEAGLNVEFMPDIPDGRQFDWVNSTIVLQHIPPAKGYDLIRRLWQCVAPSGCASLHITAFKDRRHQGELIRDLDVFRFDGQQVVNYSDGNTPGARMSMYDYDLNRVFALMSLANGQEVHLQHTDHGGCHGFVVYAQKRG